MRSGPSLGSPFAIDPADRAQKERVRSPKQFQIKTLMLVVLIVAVWLTLFRDEGMRTMMAMMAISLGLIFVLVVSFLGLGWLGFLILVALDWMMTGLNRAWQWTDSKDEPFGR